MNFIINGIEYQVEPDIEGRVTDDALHFYSPLKGFGGREFVIKPDQGEQITTHNLWEVGPSEEPDNARFIGNAPERPKLPTYDWGYR